MHPRGPLHAGGRKRWRGRTEASGSIRSAQPEMEGKAVWAAKGPGVLTSTRLVWWEWNSVQGAHLGAGMLLFRDGREKEGVKGGRKWSAGQRGQPRGVFHKVVEVVMHKS